MESSTKTSIPGGLLQATVESLQTENEELRHRLREAEEIIEAIRSGAVDAVVVEEPAGHRIYTLEGAERPYRLFVEEMEQGAATLHSDGMITWCNRQLSRLLKTPHEKLIGRLLRDFVIPDSHVVYDNLLRQAQTGSGRDEAQLQRADGTSAPAFLTFNALPKDSGLLIGVLVTDLTPQRYHERLSAAHTALLESERQLILVADTAPVFIAHFDKETRYKFVNEPYARQFGLTSKDCVGKRLVEVEGDAAAQTLHTYIDIALSGQPVEFEAEVPYAGISRRFMHYSYAPETDAKGNVIGFVAAITDISARRNMEEALRDSKTQTERQRRLYEAILTNTPDFAYVFDLNHRVVYANEILLKMWGRTKENTIGKTFLEIGYEPWHAAMHIHEIDQVAATKQPIRGEVPFTGTFGRRIYDYIFVPVLNAAGEVEAVAGTTRDITERKQAEEASARLAAIVDSSDDAIVSKTLDGIITSWNAGAERLLGYRPGEIIGRSITTIIPPDRLKEEIEIQEKLRREERVEHFETVRLAKDGRRVELSLSISPVRDASGRIIGASKIARDITERRQSEKALQAAQTKLQQHARELEEHVAQRTADLRATNEQLEAFVYSIAHDLRAPLRSMAGFSQLLVEDHSGELNETAQMLLKRIHVSSAFMDKLLLDLLAFGRAGQTEVELTSVDVRTAWEAALLQTAALAEQANARIEITGPLPVVRAHEATLGQCLANLLSNAMKFVAPGVQPQIRFRAEEMTSSNGNGVEAKVRLWVEDNGIGIAPEQQERAFRVFERLNGARYGGTGIGLSIVRKGAERMGGRVGVESESGKGSRFWIELPKAN